MVQRVSTFKVTKEKGWLYFVDKHGHIARAPMRRGAKHKGRRQIVDPRTIQREPGYLYFVDKQGYIARVRMARGRKKKR